MEKSDNLNPTSASDKLLVEIVRAIETTNNIFGKGGSGSTTPLVLNSVEYTSAGIQTTTAGKNTVMITCVDGVEKINDIVMPAEERRASHLQQDSVEIQLWSETRLGGPK